MAGRRGADVGSLLPVIKVAFVLLVGASAALTTVYGDAALSHVALAGVVGSLFGIVVVWIAFPSRPATERGRGDDPFR